VSVLTSSLSPGDVGVTYSQQLDGAGGVAPYSWGTVSGALPPGLTLSAGGVIAGTPTIAGTFAFAVQLTDADVPADQVTQALSITIAPAPVVPPSGFRITTTSLPAGDLGEPYSKRLAATEGTAPYKWKKVSKLPKGLALKAKTGVISGIPKKKSGTFSVTVRVVDKAGATATRTLPITIGPGSVQVTTATLPSGAVGSAYSTTLHAAGGTAAYKWKKQTRLPRGLKLAAKTGVLSGTPKQSGTFVVRVRASDRYSAAAAKSLVITVH
jgi:hypothetical protein